MTETPKVFSAEISVRISPTDDHKHWVAHCLNLDAFGTGLTVFEAIASLAANCGAIPIPIGDLDSIKSPSVEFESFNDLTSRSQATSWEEIQNLRPSSHPNDVFTLKIESRATIHVGRTTVFKS